MKNLLLLFALLLPALLGNAQTVIRVRNGTNIQTLVNSETFVSGTVLLLDPGSYGDVQFKKRVSLIGSGSFTGTNTTTFGTISFIDDNLTDSQGSFITGCRLSFVSMNRPNITIQRCSIYDRVGQLGIIVSSVNNFRLIQCYVDGGISLSTGISNFLIQNSIVNGTINAGSSSSNYSGKIISNVINPGGCIPLGFAENSINIIVSNNIFVTPPTCNNADGRQNYRTDYFAKFNNNIIRQGNYRSNDPSNKLLNAADVAKVFTTTGTSLEGQYMLGTDSPAKGAGEGGTDIGAFGGPEPYVIGGAPIGPTITELQVPSTARQNETIQIRLKARVQN